MQINDIIHGFRVLSKTDLSEIDAVMWRLEHVKNGADLVWLQRDDENKTFSIGFKTIPSDHTGVFHILEHSVLNGSEKYPVREPFVELIKSSMATFLNAMTYPDKTVYPVSSRNPQDFLNLMDVYLDAVINPLSVKNPHAFLQEGWHYELDSEDGELRFNGVVYNEMKGAYASKDDVMTFEMSNALFPDNCYSYDSGGHPEHIPELTYEKYLENHRKFYHPSNSRIVLDGDLDIDAALEKIDSFIGKFDRLKIDSDIPMQKPVHPAERVAEYEIGASEDDKNKAIISTGWVYADYKDLEKIMGLSVLADALCETNDSPLTKAILDAGLAEDVSMYNYDGVQQPSVNLIIKNCDPEKRGEIWKLVEDKLKELSETGLDKKHLLGILSRREFSVREKDFGGMPKGLVYALTTYESWLYGGDPAQNLCLNGVFASLRKKVDEGWFENLIKDVFLDNPHCGKVCLLPSKTLGEEKSKREAERCAKIKAGWDKSETERVMREFKELRTRQETPDSPELIDKLPKLKLSDIPKDVKICPQKVSKIGDVTVLNQDIATDGIAYIDIYFTLRDFDMTELQAASLISKILTDIPTENYSVLDLSSELQASLGRFTTQMAVSAPTGQTKIANPMFNVRIAVLEKNREEAVRLADEILNRSRFDDTTTIYNVLRQIRLNTEQAVAVRGNGYGTRRVLASFTAKDAISEAVGGIEMLRYLQKTDGEFSERGEEICRGLEKIYRKIFSSKRMIISLTGRPDDELCRKLSGIMNASEIGADAEYKTLPKGSCGFSVPAQIGFAATAANLTGKSCGGYAKVAAQLLTYDYLWNDVRVKGGAYGVHMNTPYDGSVSFSSYRDPSPARSLGSFRACAQVLRDFCDRKESVEKYIISTIANDDPLLTPRAEGEQAARRFLGGITEEDVKRERREMMETGEKELCDFADMLDRVLDEAGVCVIGGQNVLDGCELDHVEAIQ